MRIVPYIDIVDKKRLTYTDKGLTNMSRGQTYEVDDSIPILMHSAYKLKYENQLKTGYRKIWLYNKITKESLSPGFFKSKKPEERQQLVNNLPVKNGDMILIIGVGTGEDIKYLSETIDTKKTVIVGTGISLDILKECKDNLADWKLNAELVNCVPEQLPFEEGCYDAIALIGSYNFIFDKAQAIKEIVRVAKPGAHILIADETEKGSEKRKAKNSFLKTRPPFIPPAQLVPALMKDLKSEITGDSNYFVVTFRK